MENQMNAFESKELLKTAFSVIDPDGKGFITLKGLQKVVRELSLDFTEEEMRDMIDEADPTGDGQVNIASVHTMFVETHLALSNEAKKRWKEIKRRVPLPKYRKRFIAEKARVKKIPGKKLTKQEAKNINRFNKLSLKVPDKVKVTKKPGVALRERRELELEKERASEDEGDSSKKKINPKNRRVIESNAKPYATKPSSIKSKPSVRTSGVTSDTGEMSQRSVRQNGVDGYYDETDEYDQQYNDTTSLPPIEKHNGVSPQQQTSQHSPTTARKVPVYERLYDPDYRKNRSVPTEPEPIYVREFKSRPPRNLEHVKSKHMDPSYFEPRGEYILETEEEPSSPVFKAKLPKGMEHIESRHLNPEYQKKKQSSDEGGSDDQMTSAQFHARLPKGMEHVQSKILDPKYFQEKPPPEEDYYDTEFRARPPKKLENVQSRIMDPKYFQEKQQIEEEKYDTEFRARLPKKLEHVQSRLLDPPKKPKQNYEEADTVSLPSFRAKPPRHLEQVSSRILDPQYFEPKPEYSNDEDSKYDHNFKAKMPRSMQHVQSRALDPKYFKKKIPPIPTEEREANNMNHDFKARIPKNLSHVQSRVFDPAYNRALSPRSGSPVVELKQRGNVVVINVKKDPERRSKSQGYVDKSVTPRSQHYGNINYRPDGGTSGPGLPAHPSLEDEKPPEKKERKPWRPPRKPKPEKIDKEFFDSWVVSPTHIYKDSGDMFYHNRRNVSEMWTSLARSIKKSVVENGERIRPIERTPYSYY
ncbi:Centrin-3 [Mactra antiquata]